MNEELKNCPLCGSKARIFEPVDLNGFRVGFRVGCTKCFCDSPLTTVLEDAIKAWNNRPSHWHTGKPTEEWWYLTKVTDVDKPYEVLKFEDGKWYDYLDYDDVPEVVNDSFVLAYQKIEPYKAQGE